MKTNEAAAGKWGQILPEFGIDRACLDGKHHPCPCSGDGEDRFRFSDRNGSGNYFCACSDGEKGGIGLLMCKTGMSFVEVAKRVDEMIGNAREHTDRKPRQSYYSHMLKTRAVSSYRSKYLRARGLEVAPGLQWCKEVDYRDDVTGNSVHPAMLAPIMRNGEFLTYHVTYLHDGGKAAVATPRKILPGLELRGGSCPLYEPAETMGVAEGVETAIAAKMIHDVPVWAALNTSLLKHFDPPAVCKHLLIFADHDANYAGQAAAYHLAHRLHHKLESVTVFVPPREGDDWNDVLLAARKAA